MEEITLSLLDAKGILAPGELEAGMAAAAPILKRAVDGDPKYAPFLGWHMVDEAAMLERLFALLEEARRVRAEASVFAVVGVGGSNRAARAAVEALEPRDGPDMVWAGDSLSAWEMVRTVQKLEFHPSVFLNCIAKNFETLEPGIAFRLLRQQLERRYGPAGAARRIIATGTPGSALHRLCQENGYTFLTFPEDVGGRFSAGTDVGLFPMAVAGIDVRTLLKGMWDMRRRLFSEGPGENMALRYACLRKLMLERGYSLELLSFFEPRLAGFAKWWVQAFAESEGKEGTGLYPVTASYTEDLHAIGQFIQQGSPILFETFLEVRAQDAMAVVPRDNKQDGFDYLEGRDFWEMNQIARRATLEAHSQRGVPCLNFSIPALDAHTLGGLFYFFLFACYLSCELLGVNPFDQPGVEAYKGYMFKNLGKPEAN